MKKLFPILFSVVLCLTFGSDAFGQKVGTPYQVTKKFYAQLFYLQIRGLPGDAQMKDISPFLSAEIKRLIARDRQIQARFIKDRPDQKPPWIEGDLFSSLFEGSTAFQPGRVRKRAGQTEVDVNLSYLADGQYTKWTDAAVLKRIGGRWVITNIIFKGKWQFKNAGTLLRALK
jgi:hypothetical protein